MSRWESVGAEIVSTASSGAVSQQMCARNGVGPLQRERADSARYWRDVAWD